ncbi:2TM domain-containing protein [Maribacter sp. 2210JD10-5]|uniref:2TM domain-containing protein n=1 Tax=Maribacter sp. 2210JD10-5 TaxID=3386272 RepID=UPI0039BD6B18
MKDNMPTRLNVAKKKVKDIKGFYNHLLICLIINAVLFLFRDKITVVLLSKRVFGSPEFFENINWDVFGTPILWGIILLFHAANVFGKGFLFGRKWEERQIRKFMEKDHMEKVNK